MNTTYSHKKTKFKLIFLTYVINKEIPQWLRR